MSTARDILNQADALRGKARHARKAVELLAPGVRLGLSIGTFQVDNYGSDAEIRDVLIKALTEYADHQEGVADDLEARLAVTR